MKIVSKIIKYILATILAMALVGYIIVNILSSTILNKTYMLSTIEKIGYYDKIYEYSQSNFENYIQQSGFEKDILEDIVSKKKIKEDTEMMLRNMYDGIKGDVNTDSIKEKLNENIKVALGSRKLNANEQKSVDSFVDKICEEYKTTILHFDVEDEINSAYAKIMKTIKNVNTGLLITISITFVILLVLNMKRFYRSLKYIGISLFITGTLCTVINIFININIKIKNLVILNDAISEALVILVQKILNDILTYGIITLGIGIISIIVSNIIYSKRKNEHKGKNRTEI